jgi:hypothetical protein
VQDPGRPPPEERVRLLNGCTLATRIDPTGRTGPTRGEANGPGWRRTSHGFFVPASVDPARVEQRIVEAAAVLPTVGAVTGWAALRWLGATWFDGSSADGPMGEPVSLVTSFDDIRSQVGIAVSAEHLRVDDIVVVDGLRVTIAQRSALFAMRYAPSVEAAVIVADMVMEADLATPEELQAYAASLGTWTGIPQARKALALARQNSWSPQETRMRLVWVLLAGLPDPLCNVPVFDLSGRHIGTPDLLEPVAGVVGEYEGVIHLDRRRRGTDVRREQDFRDVGLEYFAVVGDDWRDEAVIVRRMRSAYRRASERTSRPRAWTIQPPAWWIPTDTVARRRALSEHERRRLLAYRAG